MLDGENAISIHAPVKGATDVAVRLHSKTQNFNPRSREGSDPLKLGTALHRGIISIPAPVTGATQGYVHGADAACISIHAPVKGATFVSSKSPYEPLFQSTLP